MCEEWQPRMRVADLARLAKSRLESMRAEGRDLHPVASASRKLASHFWGGAWMKHLARCESGGLCLAPGRTLLRHDCVLDVRIAPGRIEALVSADEVYEVSLRIEPLEDERLETLRAACSGHISSLVSLLEGKVDAAVLEHLCDPDSGLLPDPADWRMSCTCPDWAEPCPHAAAAIYAAGCLIDGHPELLFTLRSVDASSLLSVPQSAPADFNPADLSATFGIDLDVD